MKSFTKNQLDFNNLLVEESLFTLGNGYLGIRGNFEEGYKSSLDEIRGSYINGLYARIPVKYPESAYGFPKTADKQPRLFDSQGIEIYLDGYKMALTKNNSTDYKRELVFKKGLSRRRFKYINENKKEAIITFTRLVSMEIKELFLINLEIEYDGEILIESSLEVDVKNHSDDDDPRVGGDHARLITNIKTRTNPFLYGQGEVFGSGLFTSTGVSHDFIGLEKIEIKSKDENKLREDFFGKNHISLNKYSIYCDSLRHENLYETTKKLLTYSKTLGYKKIKKMQEDHYKDFFENSDIILKDREDLQMAVRFAIFQLYQSVGKDDRSNISAKGLSGEGYEGHYFWDTEIYVFPYYLVTNPKIAKNLIKFRYGQLGEAKKEARNLGAKRGAKFPWRTISGIESSAYFPAGQAQYHINGDIAYSIIQYYHAHGDIEMIKSFGLEMLFEISLFFLEVGHFKKGKFHINGVTGPDEYTALVNNNYYTNLLAKNCFFYTLKFLEEFKGSEIFKKLGCKEEDLSLIKKAEENIHLPFSKEKNIILQDDNFLNLRSWEKEDDKRPLLLHYHPLRIYNAQILKQADAVLGNFLLEEGIEEDVLKNTYDYYEKITTHDSSLSSCLYGMMACRIKEEKKAVDYFLNSVFMDMKNIQGNTKDGLHMANLAGTSMYLIYGFAGLRILSDRIVLRPIRPEDFCDYSFKINLKSSVINIEVSDKIRVKRLSGNLKKIDIFDKTYLLESEIEVDLK